MPVDVGRIVLSKGSLPTTLGTFRLGPWLQGRTDIGRPEIDTDASDGAKTTGGGTFVAGGLTVGAALDG